MIIKVKQGQEFYLRDIPEVKENIVSEKWVHDQVVSMYYNVLSRYNVEPFKISYGRGMGYCLIASSYLGLIHFDQTTLIIESAIPGLDLGKVLYLSAIAEVGQSINSSGRVIESVLDSHLELDVIDYFVISFLEVLDELIKTGIITSHDVVEDVLEVPKGRLDLAKQIQKSPGFEKFHVKRNVQSPDIIINQVILKAIKLSKEKTKLSWAIPLLKQYEEIFRGVSEGEIERSDFSKLLDEFTTLTRKDYEKALLLAEHIIFGFDPLYGENYDLFPEYLINLNEVFEKYLIQSLLKIFRKGLSKKYKVSLGLSPYDPEVSERFLELDGFYNGKANVVIDAKNKFRNIFNQGNITNFIPENPDLFQQYYYALRTNSKYVILVYPSIKKRTRPVSEFEIKHNGCPEVKFFCWALQITGSPRDNINALENLAKFIDDLQ
ncbi:5-methylcytosine restriction system specificity protein McrC [Brevibacillus borstelensis]|uniref:5-methylcytosine restriction system specificity protein McrC n=1 Tax=Brevibacillus borstelensis TaxID=45462 RepID=UPI002E1BABC3|nr:hypothetical protein [Brevibacillus borstelensis]